MAKPQESSSSTKDEEYGYTEVQSGSVVYDKPGYIKCEVPVQNQMAFMAELSTNVTDPAIDFTIVFDKMHTSVGQEYSSHSGRFTAPFSGVYLFNLVASSLTKTATDWLHEFIMKNSEQIGYIFLDYNSYHWMQRSISVVTSLSIGDHVYVKIGRKRGVSIVAGDRFHTVFSGFLIHGI